MVFGWQVPVGDFRVELICVSAFALAAVCSRWLPGREATTESASVRPHITFALRVG